MAETDESRTEVNARHPPRRTADQIAEHLETALARSPADETEIAWLELVRASARRNGTECVTELRPVRAVSVRVVEQGRRGSYRTGSGDDGALADAVRQAMVQSRAHEPLPGLPHLPERATESPKTSDPPLCRHLSSLDAAAARRLLEGFELHGAGALLSWTSGSLTVFNSRGLRSSVETTGCALIVDRGDRPGAPKLVRGRRLLEELEVQPTLDRAASLHAAGTPGELPTSFETAILSPHVVINLLDSLNRCAFTASSYAEGSSLLREHLGIQVFDRAVHLYDDAADPRGLPFPFDFEGTPKRPVDLILEGVPRTPALDQRQAAQLGLPPTAHSISGNDARAENLFLQPGSTSLDDALAAADGGVWLGWIDEVEILDPARLEFRARACGVRRIRKGALAEPLPNLDWHDNLVRLLSERPAPTSETECHCGSDGFVGGIVAPAIAVHMNGRTWRPLR